MVAKGIIDICAQGAAIDPALDLFFSFFFFVFLSSYVGICFEMS